MKIYVFCGILHMAVKNRKEIMVIIMKNAKITRKITQGMYILSTQGAGCVVDAVSQVSGGEEPLIAVAVMKKNFTNEQMHRERTFALSVLGVDGDHSLIKTFGFCSSRDRNKFEGVDTLTIEGVPVIRNSLGYMVCEKTAEIENETHTLFIGKMTEGDVFSDGEAMSYGYYQQHKEELLQVKTPSGKTAWVCSVCGYVYEGETLPDGFTCPVCGVGASLFVRK